MCVNVACQLEKLMCITLGSSGQISQSNAVFLRQRNKFCICEKAISLGNKTVPRKDSSPTDLKTVPQHF